jgi:hypothetical protein
VLTLQCRLRGWRLRELAAHAGCHQLTISRANQGRPVDRSTFAAIIDALDAHPPTPTSAALLGVPEPIEAEA